MAVKLGQILIASGVITEEQLKEALNLQKKKGGRKNLCEGMGGDYEALW